MDVGETVIAALMAIDVPGVVKAEQMLHGCVQVMNRDNVGGALAMTFEQYEQVGGYSNLFWGWGGEDNNMMARLRCCLATSCPATNCLAAKRKTTNHQTLPSNPGVHQRGAAARVMRGGGSRLGLSIFCGPLIIFPSRTLSPPVLVRPGVAWRGGTLHSRTPGHWKWGF